MYICTSTYYIPKVHCRSYLHNILVKFIYSEKATTFCEISTVDLTVTTYKDELQEWTVHSTLISENLKLVEISKNNPNTI